MAIVIPDVIGRFLERATVAIGGTRDARLVPRVHRLSGWFVGDDRGTITCLVPEQFTPHLIQNLEENGRFALTVSEIPSHETYQFKGRLTTLREVQPSHVAVCDRHREQFTARVHELFGFPELNLRAYVPEPGRAFDLAVEEIFDQTPGPRAGKRIVPATEEDSR